MTPLRREAPAGAGSSVSASRPRGAATAETHSGFGPERRSAEGAPARTEDWMSPYEDELDVPTFLRKGGAGEGTDDPEVPAFLRRSAD